MIAMSISHLLFIIGFALFSSRTEAAPLSQPIDLVHVQIQDRKELARLRQSATDLDVHYRTLQQGIAIIYANDIEQARLKSLGFNFRVMIENLSDYYAKRATKNVRQAATGSMGGFRTFAEIEQTLNHLASRFPHIVSEPFSIGQSDEGRDIWAIRLSDNPNSYEPSEPTAWFDALHHAREVMSGESLLLFAEWLATSYSTDQTVARLIDSRNILLIPCVNSDGYEYNRQQHPNGGGLWRKNRRPYGDGKRYGVDLNRNYGWEFRYDIDDPASNNYQGIAHFSENETAAIRDLLVQQTPTMSISVHTYGNEWMYPWGYTNLITPDNNIFYHYASQMVDTNGYIADTAWNLYGTTRGASDDYHYGKHHSIAFTVEIGSPEDGFWPNPSRIPTLFQAVQPGYRMVTQWAGAWVDILSPIWTEVQGNQDEWFDAGEVWRLSLRVKNEGVLPLDAEISVSSKTPNMTIEGEPFTVSIAPRQTAVSQSLDIHFAESMNSEISHLLEIALNYEGTISYEPLKIWLGQARNTDLPILTVWGKVEPGASVRIFIEGAAQVPVEVFWSLESGSAQKLPGIEGAVYLAGEIRPLFNSMTDNNGQISWLLQLPEETTLSGKTVYLQALLDREGEAIVSRLAIVHFE
jgi:carboxypeptidase T